MGSQVLQPEELLEVRGLDLSYDYRTFGEAQETIPLRSWLTQQPPALPHCLGTSSPPPTFRHGNPLPHPGSAGRNPSLASSGPTQEAPSCTGLGPGGLRKRKCGQAGPGRGEGLSSLGCPALAHGLGHRWVFPLPRESQVQASPSADLELCEDRGLLCPAQAWHKGEPCGAKGCQPYWHGSPAHTLGLTFLISKLGC